MGKVSDNHKHKHTHTRRYKHHLQLAFVFRSSILPPTQSNTLSPPVPNPTKTARHSSFAFFAVSSFAAGLGGEAFGLFLLFYVFIISHNRAIPYTHTHAAAVYKRHIRLCNGYYSPCQWSLAFCSCVCVFRRGAFEKRREDHRTCAGTERNCQAGSQRNEQSGSPGWQKVTVLCFTCAGTVR